MTLTDEHRRPRSRRSGTSSSLAGSGSSTALTARAYAALGPLLPVSDESFRRALALDAPSLGAKDRVHVATCLTHGIDLVVSADRGFDAVAEIRRIDPLDGPAVATLLEQ